MQGEGNIDAIGKTPKVPELDIECCGRIYNQNNLYISLLIL